MNPRLPKDVSLYIFSFLSKNDLAKVSRVSKACYTLASMPILWKALAQKDFGISITADENPKKKYKIAQEQARFVQYMTAYKIINETNGISFRQKEEKLQQLESIFQDEKIVNKDYDCLISDVSEDKLNEIRKDHNILFLNLISGELIIQVRDAKNKWITSNKKEIDAALSAFGYLQTMLDEGFNALCALDAETAMITLLENVKHKNLINDFSWSDYMASVVQYPCVKVINVLLNSGLNLDLNLKKWIFVEDIKFYAPPLVFIIRELFENFQLNKFKEIISLLLHKGADPELSFIGATKSQSVREYCQELLESLPKNDLGVDKEYKLDANAKQIISEALNLIINHLQPMQTLNYSR